MHYCPQRRSEKISFELGHLFDSRTNNRALFIFRRYWRLKDQLSICLLVESLLLLLLLLSISIFPIISFIATVVAMIIIFISSRFYFTIIVFITSCISFFFIQKIQCEWCGYPSCWLPTIVRFLSHGKFWVWRWWMDASHEDWRQRGAYFYWIIHFLCKPALFQNVAS